MLLVVNNSFFPLKIYLEPAPPVSYLYTTIIPFFNYENPASNGKNSFNAQILAISLSDKPPAEKTAYFC